MINNVIPQKLVVMLGEGKLAVGPAVLPMEMGGKPSLVPGIAISKVVKAKVLFGLDGAPLPHANAQDLVCVIGTPNRQAVQVILKTCMTLLDVFDKAEAEERAKIIPPTDVTPTA